MSFDVFKEAELRLEKSNTVCDIGPEVARIVFASTLPGCAEWLAGVATSEDVHAISKCFPREGLKIRPDRCWVQESRFHFCNQVRDSECFDLRVSDCPHIWDNSLESEINASVSGTKADVCNCFGIIHVIVGLRQ
jgi:hypothetical protein